MLTGILTGVVITLGTTGIEFESPKYAGTLKEVTSIPAIQIVTGKRSAVCTAYRNALEAAFLKSEWDTIYAGLTESGFRLPENMLEDRKNFSRFKVYRPFGEQGGYITLVNRTYGWRGASTIVSYFPAGVNLEDTLKQFDNQGKTIRFENIASANPALQGYEKNKIGYHPLDGRDTIVEMVWRYGKQLYLLEPINSLNQRKSKIHRIDETGNLSVVCEVGFRDSRHYQNVIKAYQHYRSSMQKLMGTDGSCGGTLNPVSRAIIYNRDFFRKVVLNAPWQESYSGYRYHSYEYRDIATLLKNYASGSIHDDLAMLEFVRNVNNLIEPLQEYYQYTFDMGNTESNFYAHKNSHNLVVNAFSHFNNDYLDYSTFQAQFYELKRLDDTKKIRALLKIILTDLDKKSAEYYEVIEYLVLYPELLKDYLAEGGDPNLANGFRKTLLMSAAHHNQLSSVKLLLRYGADIDRRTDANLYDDCSALSRDGRTALLYAAENADQELIEFIRDRSKIRLPRDNQQKSFLFYLLANDRLSFTQKQQYYTRELKTNFTEYVKHLPSYDCRKAANMIDMTTCIDGLLARKDHNVVNAYQAKLAALAGEHKRAFILQQRQWVIDKSNRCNDDFYHAGELGRCVYNYLSNQWMYLRTGDVAWKALRDIE